jgi:hypothetical protein
MEHFIEGQRVLVIANNMKDKSDINNFIGQKGIVASAYYSPTGENSIVVSLDGYRYKESLKYFTADELETVKEKETSTFHLVG